MEYSLIKLEELKWDRLERILGTFWEFADIAPVGVREDGTPVEQKQDKSKMRMPLAAILRPTLMDALKKALRPPAGWAGTKTETEGAVDLAEVTTKDDFLSAMKDMMGASEHIREEDDKVARPPEDPKR